MSRCNQHGMSNVMTVVDAAGIHLFAADPRGSRGSGVQLVRRVYASNTSGARAPRAVTEAICHSGSSPEANHEVQGQARRPVAVRWPG